MAILKQQLELDRCPHCNVDRPSLLQQFPTFATHTFDNSSARFWGVYPCQRCGGVILAGAIASNNDIDKIYPAPLLVHEALPLRARQFLEQAINSLSSPSGAIMLAASSVDSMLKDKGFREGNLYSRIEEAAKSYLITDAMSKWAHQVRLEANDQRHADDEAPLPNNVDAKRVVDFTIALGEFLYVLPSMVAKGLEDSKPTN